MNNSTTLVCMLAPRDVTHQDKSIQHPTRTEATAEIVPASLLPRALLLLPRTCVVDLCRGRYAE